MTDLWHRSGGPADGSLDRAAGWPSTCSGTAGPGTVAAMPALAAEPATVFRTRDEAADRHLEQSGLVGLVAPGQSVP